MADVHLYYDDDSRIWMHAFHFYTHDEYGEDYEVHVYYSVRRECWVVSYITAYGNDGRGGMTRVWGVASSHKEAVELFAPLVAIKNFRDEEYEKLMNERMLQFGMKDSEPLVQPWTDEHLCDTLMEKQSAWDNAVKQMKKFAKKFPSTKSVWYNGVTYAVSTAKDAQPVRRDGREFENVTQWVL